MNIVPSQDIVTLVSFLSSVFGLIAALLAIVQFLKKLNNIGIANNYIKKPAIMRFRIVAVPSVV